MRWFPGFVAGSLGLIAVYVLVQDGSAERISQAGGVGVSFLRKLMAPGVALIPNRGGPSKGVGVLGNLSQIAGTADSARIPTIPNAGPPPSGAGKTMK